MFSVATSDGQKLGVTLATIQRIAMCPVGFVKAIFSPPAITQAILVTEGVGGAIFQFAAPQAKFF